MKQVLIRNLVRPLIERVGTALATYIVASGIMTETNFAELWTAISAVVLISFDLVIARFYRAASETQEAA